MARTKQTARYTHQGMRPRMYHEVVARRQQLEQQLEAQRQREFEAEQQRLEVEARQREAQRKLEAKTTPLAMKVRFVKPVYSADDIDVTRLRAAARRNRAPPNTPMVSRRRLMFDEEHVAKKVKQETEQVPKQEPEQGSELEMLHRHISADDDEEHLQAFVEQKLMFKYPPSITRNGKVYQNSYSPK